MSSFSYSNTFTFKVPKLKIDPGTTKAKASQAKAKLTKGVLRGMSYVEQDLGAALDLAIESPTWQWPRNTIRKSGETAGNARNIIDSGKLKGSRKLTTKFSQTKSVLSIKYGVPYAGLVHNGGYIVPYGDKSRSAVAIPGRPWIDATLQGTHGISKFNLAEPFDRGFKEVFNG